MALNLLEKENKWLFCFSPCECAEIRNESYNNFTPISITKHILLYIKNVVLQYRLLFKKWLGKRLISSLYVSNDINQHVTLNVAHKKYFYCSIYYNPIYISQTYNSIVYYTCLSDYGSEFK